MQINKFKIMKQRLTLLLLALITTMSGWAATPAASAYPVAGKTYYLYAVQNSGARSYLYNNGGTLTVSQGTCAGTDAYKWTVTVSDGAYVISNVAGKKLNVSTSNLVLSDDGASFNLGKDVANEAFVSLHTNSKWWVTPSSGTTFPTNYYMSSYGTNASYTASYVFEDVDADAVKYGKDTYLGTFYKSDGSAITSNFGQKWVSKGPSAVTFENSAGNYINASNGYFFPAPSGSTYTISCQPAYRITGYTLTATGQSVVTTPQTITPVAGGSATSWAANQTNTLKVSGLHVNSTTFAMSGHNIGLAVSSFVFNVEKVNAITDLSQLSNSKSYYITGARGTLKYAAADATSMTYDATSADLTNENYRIAIIKSANNNYYAYSVTTGKFIATNNTLSDTPTPVFITATGNANYPWFISLTSDKSADNVNISDNAVKFMTHNEFDEGNRWAIVESADFAIPSTASDAIEDFEYANVTYHLIYNKVEKGNVTTKSLVGADLSVPSSHDTYCTTYKYYSDSECTSEITTVPNEDGDVYVVATWNGPVKFTTTTSAPEYYNLNIRSQYLVYDDEATGDVKLQATSDPFNPNASWAFIGDPYTGFKIINKTNGTDKYLTYTSVVTGNNHNNNNIQFIADADFTDQYWYIDTNTGGFCLRMKANPDIYFHHDNSSKFLRTCSRSEYGAVHNDAGSTILASTDEEVLFDLYDSMKDWSFGTSIGQMNTTNEGTIDNTTAKNTMLGVGSVISSSTTAAYPDAYAALQQIKNNMAVVEPTPGYYRLKNVATGKYLKATKLPEPEGYDDTHKYVYANGSSSEVGTVIQLKDENNKLYMYNQSYSFGWVVADKSHGAGVGYLTTIPDKYVHWFPGKAANQIAFAICYGNGTGDYASYLKEGIYTTDTDESVIAGTDYTTDAAQWKVEEATTITINNLNEVGAASYATLYVDFPVAIPEGNESTAIYTLSESKGVYTCNKQTSVRPGTGIIIRDISKAKSVTLSIPSTYNEEVTSALTGSFLGTTAPSNCYIFSIGDEGLGFYPYASGSALAANKAYLVPNSDSGIRGFALSFNDTETGICETETFAKDSKLFDLQGRHIAKPQHGIYIVNGKKVLF